MNVKPSTYVTAFIIILALFAAGLWDSVWEPLLIALESMP